MRSRLTIKFGLLQIEVPDQVIKTAARSAWSYGREHPVQVASLVVVVALGSGLVWLAAGRPAATAVAARVGQAALSGVSSIVVDLSA